MAHQTRIVDKLPVLGRSILKTVVYYDIFDYPLHTREIHKYLHHTSCTLQDLQAQLDSPDIQELLICKNGYFALKNRPELFEVRINRSLHSGHLWKRASHYIDLISSIPFIHYVAVTGGLCMNNTGPGSDIDVVIITRKDYLWRCRIIIQSLSRWIQYQWGDILCANYILTESHISYRKHSLYLAHEIAQMKPQFGLDTYHSFLEENKWIYRYLPNFTPESVANSIPQNKYHNKTDLKNLLYKKILGLLPENRIRNWQIDRIKRHNGPHFLQSPGVIMDQYQYKMHDKLYDQTIARKYMNKCQDLNLNH